MLVYVMNRVMFGCSLRIGSRIKLSNLQRIALVSFTHQNLLLPIAGCRCVAAPDGGSLSYSGWDCSG